MSGVVGAERIKSRKSYDKIFKSYVQILKGFKGYLNVYTSGSYNSDLSRNSFGDMDLIVLLDYNLFKNKIEAKKSLIKYLTQNNFNKRVVPFTSEKYKGRLSYNSGEIVTINYKLPNSTIASSQIDNIIAFSKEEMDFKLKFLDMPAEKQGLVLGLCKIALMEFKNTKSSPLVDSSFYKELKDNEELEFNLSSSALQLRKIEYNKDELNKGKFKTLNMTIMNASSNWKDVEDILYNFNLDLSFEELLKEINIKVKSRRGIDRIKGIFKSMVSVKSGEIDTTKGNRKLYALSQVDKLNVTSINERLQQLGYKIKYLQNFNSYIIKINDIVLSLPLRYSLNNIFYGLYRNILNGRILADVYSRYTFNNKSYLEWQFEDIDFNIFEPIGHKIPEHSYFPKTNYELINLTERLIEIRGNNCSLNDIDVSRITDMDSIFVYSKFNGDISKWNVGKVVNMSSMFSASAFNGDISNWNVSNVAYMGGMFKGSNFNGNISNWDVSNVKYMNEMFELSFLENKAPKWYKGK